VEAEMAVTFHQVFESAVQRYSSEVWSQLHPRHQIEAIYEEMRKMDANAAGPEELAKDNLPQ
jgi:hypothetical protein